ncbi:GNAT family N-acetyltransferase [Pirellula sp. SH-Sr6A]|uniref:GNAT family N-acetyltransferase n=1 Tax=Pirellula sp. SH-Sr6A TaxID=1632865 RepID=UPI001F0A1E79|nr:GNAT family N-acetyltransferase [Pirellula sp. SH-Sr6A]
MTELPPFLPGDQPLPDPLNPVKAGESDKESGKRDVLNLSIRRAKFDDQDAIMQLLEPFVEQKKLLHRTRAEILLLMGTGFVAEVTEGEPARKRIIGFSAVEIYSRKLGEIQCLAVADGYHGHGIGSSLVKACVELAREKGILEVMAISSSDAFLRNLGFDYSLPEQKRALFYQLHSRDEIFNSDE